MLGMTEGCKCRFHCWLSDNEDIQEQINLDEFWHCVYVENTGDIFGRA